MELILIGISYNIIYISIIYDDIIGIISTIILLVIGAAETAIGITMIMAI
jgi:NADH:ubiquinone oxidoreductase subunit K